MVDPLDPGTIALPLTFRRSRGRPRKADALSAAERARRYRARKKALALALAVHAVPAAAYAAVVHERDQALAHIDALRKELEQLMRQMAH